MLKSSCFSMTVGRAKALVRPPGMPPMMPMDSTRKTPGNADYVPGELTYQLPSDPPRPINMLASSSTSREYSSCTPPPRDFLAIKKRRLVLHSPPRRPPTPPPALPKIIKCIHCGAILCGTVRLLPTGVDMCLTVFSHHVL